MADSRSPNITLTSNKRRSEISKEVLHDFILQWAAKLQINKLNKILYECHYCSPKEHYDTLRNPMIPQGTITNPKENCEAFKALKKLQIWINKARDTLETLGAQNTSKYLKGTQRILKNFSCSSPRPTYRFQRIPKDFKGFQEIPKDSKRFQRIPKDSKGFQRIP